MLQFLWKWGVFALLNATAIAAIVLLFDGKMTGNAWGLGSLALAILLVLAFIGEQLWLAASEFTPTATAVIVTTTVAVLVGIGVGYAWLIKPITEMSWQLGVATLLVLFFSAVEAGLAQIGRRT